MRVFRDYHHLPPCYTQSGADVGSETTSSKKGKISVWPVGEEKVWRYRGHIRRAWEKEANIAGRTPSKVYRKNENFRKMLAFSLAVEDCLDQGKVNIFSFKYSDFGKYSDVGLRCFCYRTGWGSQAMSGLVLEMRRWYYFRVVARVVLLWNSD